MASKVPSSIRAIIINGNKAKITSISTPKTRPTYVKVKVHSVALNPTDWKHISSKSAGANSISGCDFSGTVVEVGSDVTKPLKEGDRVAGTVHGANFSEPEDGCFAEYAVAKGDLLIKIPDTLSFEDAATFPLGSFTVAQGLFQKALKLNLPTSPTKSGETVLIYGGSSATGALAIQFAKLAGYKVITTCSPRNHGYVRSLGADSAFDYRDPEVGKVINRETGNTLKLAWDTISLEASAKICADALSSDGADARYGSILPVTLPREDVTCTTTLMYTIFGEAFDKRGNHSPPLPEDFEFAKTFSAIIEGLLADGRLKTHAAKVGANGLEGVLQGMQDLKNDKVSGNKLVYHVAETPSGSAMEATL